MMMMLAAAVQDKTGEEVRCSLVHLLAALAQAGGIFFWSNGAAVCEDAVRACGACLDEPVQVRAQHPVALPASCTHAGGAHKLHQQVPHAITP